MNTEIHSSEIPGKYAQHAQSIISRYMGDILSMKSDLDTAMTSLTLATFTTLALLYRVNAMIDPGDFDRYMARHVIRVLRETGVEIPRPGGRSALEWYTELLSERDENPHRELLRKGYATLAVLAYIAMHSEIEEKKPSPEQMLEQLLA